jgi:hypothetical protein
VQPPGFSARMVSARLRSPLTMVCFIEIISNPFRRTKRGMAGFSRHFLTREHRWRAVRRFRKHCFQRCSIMCIGAPWPPVAPQMEATSALSRTGPYGAPSQHEGVGPARAPASAPWGGANAQGVIGGVATPPVGRRRLALAGGVGRVPRSCRVSLTVAIRDLRKKNPRTDPSRYRTSQTDRSRLP